MYKEVSAKEEISNCKIKGETVSNLISIKIYIDVQVSQSNKGFFKYVYVTRYRNIQLGAFIIYFGKQNDGQEPKKYNLRFS